ncbi:MAG: hypothetical protein K2X87_08005 [Gemmataceae bacterium]|nr:hypothetical protein [Gemmataceae bacterium]
MTLRRHRHALVAAAAVLHAGGVAAAALTGVSSMMALSTLLVAVAAWAYGPAGGLAAILYAHPVSALVMTTAGTAEGPAAHPAVILLPVVVTELLVTAAMSALRRLEFRQAAAEADLRTRNAELSAALAEVKELRGMLPICAWCKSIRDVDGMWDRLEDYLARHSCATLTHGVCPGCLGRMEAELAAAGRAG